MQQTAARRIDGDHFPGCEAPHFHDVPQIDSGDSDLRAKAYHAFVGQHVASRTQTVPVKAGSDRKSVRETERSRAIPRFANAAMILVKVGDRLRSIFVRTPCRRNEHGHCMQDAATAHREHLEHVIEARGVRAAWLNYRLEEINVLSPEICLQFSLTGNRPVAISANGIDFPVVRKHSKRLGERPLRKGICAIPLVIHANGRLIIRIRQVRIILLQGGGNEQPFVNDHPMRKRRDVEIANLVRRSRVLDLIAGKKEAPFVIVIGHAPRLANENMLDSSAWSFAPSRQGREC